MAPHAAKGNARRRKARRDWDEMSTKMTMHNASAMLISKSVTPRRHPRRHKISYGTDHCPRESRKAVQTTLLGILIFIDCTTRNWGNEEVSIRV